VNLFPCAEPADLGLESGQHVEYRRFARAAMADQPYLHGLVFS
jgi:hypothetical protein